MSEISILNFLNINAYKFGEPAILASKHYSLLTALRGVYRTPFIYLEATVLVEHGFGVSESHHI